MKNKIYRVISGPFIEEIDRIYKSNKNAIEILKEVSSDINGEIMIADHSGFVGFQCESEPDRYYWKKTRRGLYWPKKNTVAGKMLNSMIKDANYTDIREAITVLGYSDGPSIISGGYAHRVSFCGCPTKMEFYIKVPVAEYSEAELLQYDKDRSDGKCRYMNMDFALHPKHESMIEVEEWEMMKFMSSLKD
jgi:hypothetical protein